MQRLKAAFLSLLSLLIVQACKVKKVQSDANPVEHQLWDTLLSSHVSEDGLVDYEGFIRDSSRLNEYLDMLSDHHPNDANWSREERLAYWINAYNAFTVKLIIKNYPTASIKDIQPGITFINTVWDIKFIEIEGEQYDLNNIEHGIIRPRFDEPRIHFAVNCAAVSCPILQNRAYTAKQLDQQLDYAARTFINDPTRNKLSEDQLQLSKIFNWYGGDFGGRSALIPFIRQYTQQEIRDDADISFLDYNWALNSQVPAMQ